MRGDDDNILPAVTVHSHALVDMDSHGIVSTGGCGEVLACKYFEHYLSVLGTVEQADIACGGRS